MEISSYLSSPELLRDPRNHATPVLDILTDPVDENAVIIVTPLLRRVDTPSPGSVREYVDFVYQMLEVRRCVSPIVASQPARRA